MNIVFVTFTYGLALPELFMYGLACIFVTYVVDKLCLVYYYKEPPSYDTKLNSTAIKILKWAPVLTFAVGFWMFSNRQIFENYACVNPQASPEVEKTGHVIFRNVVDGPAFFLFLAFFILLLVYIFFSKLSRVYKRSSVAIKYQGDINENLPSYFEALDYDDSLYLMVIEKYIRKFYGVKTMLDSTLEGIASAKPSDRKILGVAVYDPLANVRYAERFQFDYIEQVFRNNFEEESTKVKLWMSLAFMLDSDTRLKLKIFNIKKNDFLKNNSASMFSSMIDASVEEKINSKSIQVMEAFEELERDDDDDEDDVKELDEENKDKSSELKELLLPPSSIN